MRLEDINFELLAKHVNGLNSFSHRDIDVSVSIIAYINLLNKHGLKLEHRSMSSHLLNSTYFPDQMVHDYFKVNNVLVELNLAPSKLFELTEDHNGNILFVSIYNSQGGLAEITHSARYSFIQKSQLSYVERI